MLSQHTPFVVIHVVSLSGSPGLWGHASTCPIQTLLQMGNGAGQSASETALFVLTPSMLFSPQSEMSETRQGRTSSTGEEEESLAILRR